MLNMHLSATKIIAESSAYTIIRQYICSLSILASERHCSNTKPKYFTVCFAAIAVPLQVILKTDCDFNLSLDPNSIDSALTKCRESLLSTSHSLTISS